MEEDLVYVFGFVALCVAVLWLVTPQVALWASITARLPF
jgi:hypothetical protein